MLRPPGQPLYWGWLWPVVRAVVRRALFFVLALAWLFWAVMMIDHLVARVAYERGEPATAIVDECGWESNRVAFRECRGTWLFDDAGAGPGPGPGAGRGVVRGANAADVGTSIRVRATPTSAYAPPASVSTLLCLTAAPLAGTVALWLWRRRADSPPSPSPPPASPPPPSSPFPGRTIDGEWR